MGQASLLSDSPGAAATRYGGYARPLSPTTTDRASIAAILAVAVLVVWLPQLPSRAAAASLSTPGVSPTNCGPNSVPETGLQGAVPIVDQESGRSKLGYRCNFSLVGQNDLRSRGANLQMAWLDNCAYVGMGGQAAQVPGVTPAEAGSELGGIAVVDASDPHHPQFVRLLQSPVGGYEHEAMHVNEQRRILVTEIGGAFAQWIEIWDLSQDCRNPVFRGRFDGVRPQYHGLRISPDGRTIYATNTLPDPEVLQAIDISDLTKPKLVATWGPAQSGLEPLGVHDLEISPDGRRGYLGAIPLDGLASLAGSPCCSLSLVIVDLTQIQDRQRHPSLAVVSTLAAPNFGHALKLGHIGGKPFLFLSGERPFAGPSFCPWAWGHIVDVSNERAPRVVSNIRLQVNDPANCSKRRTRQR